MTDDHYNSTPLVWGLHELTPVMEVWYVYKTGPNVLRMVGTSWGVCMAGC